MYKRTTAHICSQIHPGNRRTYLLVTLTSVGVGFREGRGAIHSLHRRAGEGNYDTGHVVEDLAGEPERAPPRQSQPSIQLDCGQGKCKAATGKARPFGPPPDEVDNMRKPVVGIPENTRSAWDFKPGLELHRMQGDDRICSNVGHPITTPRVSRQDHLVRAIPVVGCLYSTLAARPAPGHGSADTEAVS